MLHLHLLLEEDAEEEERVFMVSSELADRAWNQITDEVLVLKRLGEDKVRRAKQIIEFYIDLGRYEDIGNTSEG